MPAIEQISNSVSLAAQEYPIKKAELFGSYASGNSRADSGVDLLLEFHAPRVSLLTLNSLKYRLEELLKTEVDVVHGPLETDSLLEIDRRILVWAGK